mgnify:FL=1
MRVVLKISGESLSGNGCIDSLMLDRVLTQVKELSLDNEVILVVGGGNFWRGRNDLNINKVVSDNIGMLATVMNGMAISSYLNECGIKSRCYGSFDVSGMVLRENVSSVLDDLSNGYVVVFGGGLGVANLSTDMTTVSKAISYDADFILMAKNVDGVYDKDPKKFDAKKFDILTHQELFDLSIKQGASSLMILDIEALAALVKHKIPMYIYNSSDINNLNDVIDGKVGTKVVS